MLTFFAITAIVNLALGYGLAVYWGRTRGNPPGIALPEQATLPVVDSPPSAPSVTPDVTTRSPTATLTSEVVPPSLPGMPAPELPGLVSPLRSSGTQNPPAVVEESQTEMPPVTDPMEDQQSDDSEQVIEKDLLVGIAAFRAQLSTVQSSTESVDDKKVETRVPLPSS